jgi:hypothetical protein
MKRPFAFCHFAYDSNIGERAREAKNIPGGEVYYTKISLPLHNSSYKLRSKEELMNMMELF